MIDDTPYPGRAPRKNRYTDVFEKLKPKQCVKVLPEDVIKTAAALRKYLKATKKYPDCELRLIAECEGDGFGRIWLQPKKATMKDLPGRIVTKLNMEDA